MDKSPDSDRYQRIAKRLDPKLIDYVKRTGRLNDAEGLPPEQDIALAIEVSKEQPLASLHLLDDAYKRMRALGKLRPDSLAERREVYEELRILKEQIGDLADGIEKGYREKGREMDYSEKGLLRKYRGTATEIADDLKRLKLD